MSDKINLLPCPCCKAKAYTDRIGNPLFTIHCTNVKCGLKVCKPSLKEAVEVWNNREPMDSIIDTLMKEQLDARQLKDNGVEYGEVIMQACK